MPSISLNIPAGNGVGSSSDTTAFAPTKTVIVSGPFIGIVTLEAQLGSSEWCQIGSFNGPSQKQVVFPATALRVRVAGLKSGTPVVGISAEDGTVGAIELDVPAADGVGTSRDISSLGNELSALVGPSGFTGSISIEVSSDNTNFRPAMDSFTGPGCKTEVAPANYVRVRRSGFKPGGTTPIVSVGSDETGGGAANSVDVTWLPKELRTIYVRTTGSDTEGDGTLANPYLTFEKAVADIPYLDGTTFYRIDITDMGNITLSTDPQGFFFDMPPIQRGVTINYSASDFGITPSQNDPIAFSWPDVIVKADPTLLQQIESGDISGTVTDAAGFITIQTTLALTPGALVGKQIYNSENGNGQIRDAVIVANTATDITINSTSFGFDVSEAPLFVTEPSARFQTPFSISNNFLGGIGFTNIGFDANSSFLPSRLQFLGCDIQAVLTATPTTRLQLTSTVVNGELYCDVIESGPSAGFLWKLYVEGATAVRLPARHRIFSCWFENCRAIHLTFESSGSNEPVPCSQEWDAVKVLNSTQQGVIVDAGQFILFTNCDIAGSSSDGILVRRGGQAVLTSSVSSSADNGGVGVKLESGAQAQGNVGATITGTSGDYQVGGNVASAGGGAGWAALTDENDLAAGTPELCRLYT